jgi:tetratricopeptide (TPR) repeat protein
MLPVLLQPLRDLTEQGKELGFTWGETDVQAAHDFEVVTNTLHLVMEKFWIDIGKEMLPRMVELVHAVTTSTALLDGLKLVAGVVAFAIKGVFDEMRLKETILYLEAAYRLALATGMIPDLTAYEDEVAVRIAIAEKLLKNRGAALQPPEQSDNADTYLATVNRQMGVAALAADEYTESLRKLNPEADKEARRLFETGASLKVVTDQLQKYNIVTDEEISLLAGVEGQVRKAMKAREEAAQEALSQFRKGVAAQKKDEADHLKERAAAEKAVDAQSLRAVKVAMDAENVKHKAAIQHYAELFVAAGEAADALAAMGLSGTDLDVYNLKRARAAEVAKLGDQPGRAGASQDVYDKAKTAIDARYDREVERAKGAYRTIEESMRAHGDSTSAEREKDYQDAKKYYDDLVESDSASEDQISAAREKMWAADAARRGESLSGWRATNAELARSFQQLAQIATGTMSDVASAIGTVFGALDTLGSAMTTLQTSLTKIKTKGSKGAGFMELAESIMAAVGAAVALHSALNSLFGIKSDSKAGNAATGAASGAMAGAMIGSAVPGIGTAIGAGIGALIGLFGGLSSAMKAANKAKEDFAALGKEIDKTYGSIANAATAAGLLGVALTSTTDRSVAGVKKLTAEMKVLAEKMAELQAALDKYGFTWEDMGEAWQKLHFEKFADQLLDDFHLLINSGIESNKVIAGMADALSELVGASVRTGQKIPAALQPILAKLIEMGKLSTEAQQALLGLGDGVAYAWDDVQAAMERYGLTAAMLGGPMMQKQIDAQAKTITADWKILTGSGADVNTVALGMANQVQAIIDAAMSSGLSIDAGLKPIIQALAGMGQLRGKNGAAFDESLLSYQQTSDDIMTGVANENTDRLLAKLNELISAVGGTPKSIRSRTPNVDGLGGGSSTGRTSDGTGAIPGGRSGLTTNVNLNLDGRELTRATITQEYAYANLYGNR